MRRELLLPSDTLGTNDFALLEIHDPKARLDILVPNWTSVILSGLLNRLFLTCVLTNVFGLFLRKLFVFGSGTFSVRCGCNLESFKVPKLWTPGLTWRCDMAAAARRE